MAPQPIENMIQSSNCGLNPRPCMTWPCLPPSTTIVCYETISSTLLFYFLKYAIEPLDFCTCLPLQRYSSSDFVWLAPHPLGLGLNVTFSKVFYYLF